MLCVHSTFSFSDFFSPFALADAQTPHGDTVACQLMASSQIHLSTCRQSWCLSTSSHSTQPSVVHRQPHSLFEIFSSKLSFPGTLRPCLLTIFLDLAHMNVSFYGVIRRQARRPFQMASAQSMVKNTPLRIRWPVSHAHSLALCFLVYYWLWKWSPESVLSKFTFP